jgi:cellulose synthase/poly-beta-1,6-N-acetylglucosamine synthase-like glycosyltransferase
LPPEPARADGIAYSVVIPVYGNRETLGAVIERLTKVADRLPGQLEIVFVVDGSPDDSFEVLCGLLPQQRLKAQVLVR